MALTASRGLTLNGRYGMVLLKYINPCEGWFFGIIFLAGGQWNIISSHLAVDQMRKIMIFFPMAFV